MNEYVLQLTSNDLMKVLWTVAFLICVIRAVWKITD